MNQSELMQLYIIFRNETHKSLEVHAQHFGRYLTLLTAILGVTIATFNYFNNSLLAQGVSVVVGGGLGIGIAILGKKLCDRFYEGMLEGISVTAKIEALLGLDADHNFEMGPFERDRHLLPDRWIEGRGKYHSTSEFVAQSLGQGSNRVVHSTFHALILLNVLVLLYGLIRTLVASKFLCPGS